MIAGATKIRTLCSKWQLQRPKSEPFAQNDSWNDQSPNPSIRPGWSLIFPGTTPGRTTNVFYFIGEYKARLVVYISWDDSRRNSAEVHSAKVNLQGYSRIRSSCFIFKRKGRKMVNANCVNLGLIATCPRDTLTGWVGGMPLRV